MGRSKQNKNNSNASKDGKYRKETKEEKKLRLKEQEEAREACLKVLPMVGGAVLVFLVIFALYVRSVPPRVMPTIEMDSMQQPQFQGGVPDFMKADAQPLVKEALDEAAEALKNRDGEDEKENVETIEL